MMTICDCYHEEYGEPRCWGTKDVEPCICEGDRTKCDFYPEVRKDAIKEKTKKQSIAVMPDRNIDLNKLIDECLKKKDRYITIFVGENGTSISIYPYTEQEKEDD